MTAAEKAASRVRFIRTAPHWIRASCNRCGQDIVYQKGTVMLAEDDGYPVCPECADAIENPSQVSKSNLELKERLLTEARGKGVVRVYQLDGWLDRDHFDDILEPDSDGDCIIGGCTEELRRSPGDLAVRVHIHEDALGRPGDVLRVLKKIVRRLEFDTMRTGGRTLDFLADSKPGPNIWWRPDASPVTRTILSDLAQMADGTGDDFDF